MYRSKKKKIKRKHKGKHAIYIKEAGEKVQIDVKYAFFGEMHYYQFTAVDIATRMSLRYLHDDEKSPYSTIDFMKRLMDIFLLEYIVFKAIMVQNLLTVNIHLTQNTL